MNLIISFMGVEFVSVSLSFPKLGVFALDSVPDSFEVSEDE